MKIKYLLLIIAHMVIFSINANASDSILKVEKITNFYGKTTREYLQNIAIKYASKQFDSLDISAMIDVQCKSVSDVCDAPYNFNFSTSFRILENEKNIDNQKKMNVVTAIANAVNTELPDLVLITDEASEEICTKFNNIYKQNMPYLYENIQITTFPEISKNIYSLDNYAGCFSSNGKMFLYFTVFTR